MALNLRRGLLRIWAVVKSQPIDSYTAGVLTLALLAAGWAAFSAWKQIGIAKAIARNELRAYLSVEPATAIEPGNDGVFTQIPLYIANSGQTPAYNLALRIFGFAETPEAQKRYQLNFTRKEVTPSDIGFVPGNASRLRFAQIVKSKPTIESLTQGGHLLWAGGKVFYEDAFGSEHWVTFCISWSPDDFSPEGATYCPNQNETDPPENVLQ